MRIIAHLFPLRDPAWQAAQCKHDREHLGGNAHRPVDDAAVEIDVRVELALNEVFVAQGDLFQVLGDAQQGVMLP